MTRTGPRDRLLGGANWQAIRAYWLALRLPCARGGLPIDYDTGRYLKRADGTKIVNPWSLVVGHIIGRDQAKQLGWSDDKINSRANTQPEHVRCCASSGGKYVRNRQQLRGYAGHSGVGLPIDVGHAVAYVPRVVTV